MGAFKQIAAGDLADADNARFGILLYRVVGSMEIMACQQLFNVAIRRGKVGSPCWIDQW